MINDSVTDGGCALFGAFGHGTASGISDHAHHCLKSGTAAPIGTVDSSGTLVPSGGWFSVG